jgi:trehalose 6-phosphate phosphatase
VGRPEEAHVPAATLATLERLAACCRVAVISGRDLNTVRRLVPIDDVIAIGSHGLESSFDHDLLPALDRVRLAAALERTEQQVITAVPSAYLHVEHKAISTAFHYRDRPGLGPALEKVLASLPEGLMLRRGKMVLEVMPEARGGKDRALLALASRFRSRSVLVMGDDDTDVAMFRAAQRLRGEGVHVLVAGVTSGDETPSGLVDAADVLLPSVEAAHAALGVLLAALEELGR